MTCPYCRATIAPEQSAVTCTRCGLPYHRECWQENGGCATYGCAGGATLQSRARPAPESVEVELGPEPGPRRGQFPPAPAAPPEPWLRPLLVVVCEALGIVGAAVGAVAGAVQGARYGLLGIAVGLFGGLAVGAVAGALAVPAAILAGCFYLAEWTIPRWGVPGVLTPLALCLGAFALLLRIRVQSWPPIFR